MGKVPDIILPQVKRMPELHKKLPRATGAAKTTIVRQIAAGVAGHILKM